MNEDDADQAGNDQECHETERRSGDKQRKQSAHDSVGHSRKDKERLDSVIELQHECQKNCSDRNSHDNRKISEAFDLLGILAPDNHLVAWRKRRLEGQELWHCATQYFPLTNPSNRTTLPADG